jgi:hypothetical protein
MVLLIQYKTVQPYTLPEHKNLSIAAIIGTAGYPEIIYAQLLKCPHFYGISLNISFFPGNVGNNSAANNKKRVFLKKLFSGSG